MSVSNAYLVLQGGRVLDPASGLDAVADVVVRDGTIVEVGTNAAANHPDAKVRDVSGHLVTPGLKIGTAAAKSDSGFAENEKMSFHFWSSTVRRTEYIRGRR